MADIELAQRIIRFFNELLQNDKDAIHALVENRVRCNLNLANHPYVQVSQTPKDSYEVGMLGLLNGLCGVYYSGPRKGWGPITAVFDDKTKKLVKFELTNNKPKSKAVKVKSR